jgi:ankyrin repeat protein
MKRKSNDEKNQDQQIEEEIQRRVFEESRKRMQKKIEAEEEQIEIDALSEVSELPPEEIKRIAEEVKTEFEQPAKKSRRFGVQHIIAILLIIGAAGIISFAIVNGIVKQQGKEAESKKLALYFELLKAIEAGNISMTEYLLDRGAPMQMNSPYTADNNSALMTAAEKEHVPIVRLLLKRGADVTIRREREGWTALDFADYRQNQVLVRILGQAMADAYPENSPVRKLWEKSIPFSQYAFVEQVKQNNKDAVRLFLEAGMNLNAEGRYNTYDNIPALAIACRDGNIEMVELILSYANAQNKPLLKTPMYWAVREEKKDIVKLLLDSGADPDSVLVYDALGNLEIAGLLLDYGSDINAGVGDNQVPALIQVMDRWATVVDDATRKKWVRFLLDHGADVKIRGGGLKTALQMARQWGDPEVIGWIIKAGATEIDTE